MTALRDAALWTAGWLGAGAAAGAGLWFLAGVQTPVAAALGGLAAAAPLAAWAALAGLLGRIADLETQLDALRRTPPAAAPEIPGLSREDLARALGQAAREALDAERGAIARRIAELAETQRRFTATLDALDALGPRPAPPPPPPTPTPPAPAPMPAPAPPPPPDPQQSLPLAGADPAAPDWGVIARALDFPRDASDADGFRALETATRDAGAAALLQAAEDALTLLAQHGLYMEDLSVRLAPPDLWRRFAEGARGPDFAAIGGIEDDEPLDRARTLMKSDPIFRDTAMHLMRRFDSLLRRVAADPAGPDALPAMADSRTGRAFMLTARALGAFD